MLLKQLNKQMAGSLLNPIGTHGAKEKKTTK